MNGQRALTLGLLAAICVAVVFAAHAAGFTISRASDPTATTVPPTATVVVASAPPTATLAPMTHLITGVLTLKNALTVEEAAKVGACQGTGGYSDIRGGAQIVVRNESGQTIAIGNLEPGNYGDIAVRPDGGGVFSCTFGFQIANVPDAGFYSIAIGGRGGPTYSRDEMGTRGWTMSLSLGS